MIIDTHAHLNFNAFKNDLDEVIKRCIEENVWVINVSSQYDTSKRAVEIAKRYDKNKIFAAVGLHPVHLSSGVFKTKIDKEEIEFETKEEKFDYDKYKKLAEFAKVVAIGEIGLDYYYKPKTKINFYQFQEKQKSVLLRQIDLAKELNLPIIFHCRMAHKDLIEILEKQKNIKGVIHCFTGSVNDMEKYLAMGFYIGFTGIIFKLDLAEVIKKCPLERILIETDCPYLTPPQQKNKRNEPIFVKYVAERIADIKNTNLKSILEITTKNAKKLFNI